MTRREARENSAIFRKFDDLFPQSVAAGEHCPPPSAPLIWSEKRARRGPEPRRLSFTAARRDPAQRRSRPAPRLVRAGSGSGPSGRARAGYWTPRAVHALRQWTSRSAGVYLRAAPDGRLASWHGRDEPAVGEQRASGENRAFALDDRERTGRPARTRRASRAGGAPLVRARRVIGLHGSCGDTHRKCTRAWRVDAGCSRGALDGRDDPRNAPTLIARAAYALEVDELDDQRRRRRRSWQTVLLYPFGHGADDESGARGHRRRRGVGGGWPHRLCRPVRVGAAGGGGGDRRARQAGHAGARQLPYASLHGARSHHRRRAAAARLARGRDGPHARDRPRRALRGRAPRLRGEPEERQHDAGRELLLPAAPRRSARKRRPSAPCATAACAARSRAATMRATTRPTSSSPSTSRTGAVEALAKRWHGAENGRLRLSLGPVLPWVVDVDGAAPQPRARRAARPRPAHARRRVARIQREDRAAPSEALAQRRAPGTRPAASVRRRQAVAVVRHLPRRDSPARENGHGGGVRSADAALLGHGLSVDQAVPRRRR